MSRLVVLVIAALGIYMAYEHQGSSLLSMVAYAWGGFGAAFGPVILLSLFWPRMTGAGALAGMITGAAVVVVWKQLNGGVFEMFEVVPGFAAALVAIVVVSLLTKAEPPTVPLDYRPQ